MLRFKYLLTLAGIYLLSYSHPTPSHSSFSWAETKYLITFGDSYTYVQGTHGLQNFSFIGDLLDFSFTASELLSDYIVQNFTATAEGGPNWVEFLTRCGLQPGLTNPRDCERQLWDFAFGGADITEQYTPLHHNFTVPLVNQTHQFEHYAYPVLKEFTKPEKTLVGIWIGINDINDSDEYNVNFPTFYNELMAALFGAVQSIHQLGYNNFLFMQLPPLNRTPPNLIRTGGPLPNATMIDWYNEALTRYSENFAVANRGTKVMVFPTTSFLNYVLDHPAEYGITNTTQYCPAYEQLGVLTDPAAYGCDPLDQYL